jgi:hypothetical protein
MKQYIKTLGLAFVAGISLLTTTSCNDWVDKQPITDITPDDYYKTPDQLAAYLNNYYTAHLVQPFNYISYMFHTTSSYNDGLNRSDVNTDIACIGGGSTTWFANNHWQTPTGKSLQTYYGYVRIWNFFLDKAITNFEKGDITGDQALAKNYIGEGYFFRALAYFRILAKFGDAPIITDVLNDDDDELVAASVRDPRNEVARFILSDLDKAIEYLADRSQFNGQRVNKECAYLLKSRVALFEATFEKYHRGSGRVPGDAEWPGAKMSYNQGKSFDIDGEIKFFLDECMSAAKEAVGTAALTTNNFVTEPKPGTITGWNPYFEMYSQPSLADNNEVLLWREYSASNYLQHSAPYRSIVGCNDGMTKAFVDAFVMTDGKPYYASDLYAGDTSIDKVKTDRDYRLQLFLWSESTLKRSDPQFTDYTETGTLMGVPDIINSNNECRMITGYMSRKYVTYDYSQTYGDNVLATNACPAFRTAEARLNYIEACYERNNSLDATADAYWREIRERAGVNPDYNITIANTDLSKEEEWSVYSGTTQVDATLFNIRRERMCETFNEGLRFADLIRWRSFDMLMVQNWVPEGCNFWDEMYELGKDTKYKSLIAEGTSSSNVSRKELGKYLRPYSINENISTNELANGYTWHDAYYLSPLGARDITTASSDRLVETSNMYQNINWPNEGGLYCLK